MDTFQNGHLPKCFRAWSVFIFKNYHSAVSQLFRVFFWLPGSQKKERRGVLWSGSCHCVRMLSAFVAGTWVHWPLHLTLVSRTGWSMLVQCSCSIPNRCDRNKDNEQRPFNIDFGIRFFPRSHKAASILCALTRAHLKSWHVMARFPVDALTRGFSRQMYIRWIPMFWAVWCVFFGS